MDSPGNTSAYSAAAVEDEVSAPERASAAEATYPVRPTPESVAVSAPAGWNPFTRVGFRIAFIYFICFMWLYGNDGADINSIVVWHGLGNFLNWPLNHVLLWTGGHIFQVKKMPPHWHVADRGDALGNWVLVKVFIFASLLGGLVWTAAARLSRSTRTEYRTLLAWLRFFLRLSVGFFMIAYGMIKVFPLQMPPIPLAVLNQPTGQMTPHNLLWSLVGLYPTYEFICGAVEVVAGTLVLFRRTALVGTLLSIFLMSNVVLYNFFFGVSVKLFAVNLLLAEIFLVLPDAKPMFDFFWEHKAATQTGTWTPPLTRRGVRWYVRSLEIVFIVASLTVNPMFDGAYLHHLHEVARIHSPLLGGWRLDSTHSASGPFVLNSKPATELYVDSVERAVTRCTDGTLWRTFLKVDPAAHTMKVSPYVGNDVTYQWRMPDANHLILTSMPPNNAAKGSTGPKGGATKPPTVVTLTRIPLPAKYPLYSDKFKWVSYY